MTTNMPPPGWVPYAEVDGETVHNIAILLPKSTQNDMFDRPIPVFPGKDIFVGRDEDICCPCIPNIIVSKEHFRIYSVVYDQDNMHEYPPIFYCEDRQSLNGTYINNTLIGTHDSPRSPYLLNDGDMISIRPYWTFLFRQTKPADAEELDNLQTQETQRFEDRYKISSRMLGSGVYGKVFLANDVLNMTQVACKVVDLRERAADGPNAQNTPPRGTYCMELQTNTEKGKAITNGRKKLLREIEILSKISHPNIVTLYKAFRTPHSLYVLIELAAGGDLFSFLQQNGPSLEDHHARVISRQIAIAVKYLHANGVAHRDLKPENTLVMRAGIGHRVVLTDFGCAGYIGSESSRMRSIVGTLDYVAPEVHKQETRGYTEAVDMWSLGIITLCLLTGETIVSTEERHDLTQIDIADKLDKAALKYPHWEKLREQGKDFIQKLIVIEPLQRMTAKEAVDHDWFQTPSKIAAALDELYERSIASWHRRSNNAGIVEDLPDVLSKLGKSKRVRTEKLGTCYRGSHPRKIPDATSPYFGLDRHTRLRRAHAQSSLYLSRQQILEELKETASQFIDTTAQLKRGKPTLAETAIEQFTPQPEYATVTLRKRRSSFVNISSGVNMHAGEAEERLVETQIRSHRKTCATDSRRWEPSPETGSTIRQVDALDIFSTEPIEIQAARAAEVASFATNDLLSSTPEDKVMEDSSSTERSPRKQLMRSYGLSQDDRDLHDEAARGLPKLSDAKAFSYAITKCKKLRGS